MYWFLVLFFNTINSLLCPDKISYEHYVKTTKIVMNLYIFQNFFFIVTFRLVLRWPFTKSQLFSNNIYRSNKYHFFTFCLVNYILRLDT